MWYSPGGCPGSSSPVMVPAGPTSKDNISYVFDGKMGFDGIVEDITFYVNAILLTPKPLVMDLNVY